MVISFARVTVRIHEDHGLGKAQSLAGEFLQAPDGSHCELVLFSQGKTFNLTKFVQNGIRITTKIFAYSHITSADLCGDLSES